MPGFPLVLDALPTEPALRNVRRDTGAESHASRARLNDEEINPVIPPKSYRKDVRESDTALYKYEERKSRGSSTNCNHIDVC